MNLQQLVNLNLAVLAVLSAALVGLGEPNLLLPLGMMLAAAASLWFCDRLGRVELDRWVINVAVLATAAIAAWRFAQVGGAPDAAVAADGLIALQAVMLFERKTARTHWDLFSLSLLQTFLSCGFNHGPMFAVMLVINLFFILSALTLLSLHRENAGSLIGRNLRAPSIAPPRRLRTDWWQVAGVAAATLLVGPLSLYLRFHTFPAEDDPAQPTGNKPSASGETSRGMAVEPREPPRHVVASGRPRDRFGWEFWWRTGSMTLVSLLIGAAVFFITPRFGGINLSLLRGGAGGWRSAPAALQRTVGFDDQVQLGELGSTLDNTQKVLTVRFRRHRDSTPYPVSGDLFLRGAVLNRYRDGRWEHRSPGDEIQVPLLDMERRDAPADLIRQEFRLEPLDRPELFCVWPSVYVARDDRVQFDPATQRFLRSGGLLRRSFAYELATAALADGRQTDLVPALARVDLQPLLDWPAESLPNLAGLARQWLDQADVPARDPVGRVRALERALRSSPRFSYRLGEQPRDRTLDPIEDFIVNDPRGHCEYFASALTLMLRSQGLPARLVVGYKSDEFNYLEERYWVRQSHAHAWVEAFIPPEAIPDRVRDRHPSFDWSHGGWLRLDPTPSSLSELSLVEYLKQKLRNWQAAARTAWTQHVMQMSGTRQNSLIYRPMIQTLRETVTQLSSVAWWRNELGGSEYSTTPRELLARIVPWILGGMMAFAVLAWQTLRHRRSGRARGNRWRSSRSGPSSNGRFAASVEFYQRWEVLFQRCGLYRGPGQTPREFACEAGGQLAEAADQPQLRDAALCVIDAFYEIRFGGATLDDRQTAAVDEALQSIQQAVRHFRADRSVVQTSSSAADRAR